MTLNTIAPVIDTGLPLLIREATLADDAQICAQMRRNAMPGPISLAISPDPSFFESIEVEGYSHRIVAGERDGQIVGVGLTAKRRIFLNGKPSDIGYISSLRADVSIRNTTALARGFRLFRKWHNEDGSPFYLCSILKNNLLANRILTSGRSGLPASHDIGTLYTAAIPLIKRPFARRPNGLSIVRGSRVGAEAIVEFMNRAGRSKQFFPVYTVADLLANDGILRGLHLDDFYIALAGDKIVGLTACWNQLAFRRMVVADYSGSMRWLKPLLSPLARALKLASLPDAGDSVKSVMTACITIENNEPKIFRALLSAILHDEYASGKTFLMVGLMEGDPLLQVAQKYLHLPTRSCIYALEWESAEAVAKLDGRIPYLELGSL